MKQKVISIGNEIRDLPDLEEYEKRSAAAQGEAAHAYSRLIEIALTSDSGQAGRCARFFAATHNGRFHFDLFDLRVMDVELSDHMLTCLDALRWGKNDLYRLVPDGESKVVEVIEIWNLKANSNNG